MFELNLTPNDDVQSALDRLPEGVLTRVRLAAGRYFQKLRIRRDGLVLEGEGADRTALVFDDCNDRIHADGRPFNTFRTPTLTILADGVTVSGLSIENVAGFGPGVGQAVALSVSGTDFVMTDCVLKGHQDTLFCGPLPYDLSLRYRDFLPDEELHARPSRQRYRRTRIEGTVDFIFGGAFALFDDCEIVVLGKGYVAAPSTPVDQPFGLVFHHCKIRNASGSSEVWLGRPWRENGMAGFLDCTFEGPFASPRFLDWEKPRFRFYETPYGSDALSRPFTQEETERLRHLLADDSSRPGQK
ncbi:MAG: hypothetical protein A2Y16_02955 [Tenericutes bacterium GWF2_57_13]|nr:MAG: hypothetical protein A2Y16_02955 [Tenericutes bacterium GWF2_57_13]